MPKMFPYARKYSKGDYLNEAFKRSMGNYLPETVKFLPILKVVY